MARTLAVSLLSAVHRGDLNALDDALARAELQKPGPVIRAAFQAAGSGKLACLRRFLDWGIDPNALDDEKGPLAMAATDGGHADCLALLLSRGADPNARDKEGWSAAIDAAQFGQLECLRLLLDAGADARDKNPRGVSCSSLAARHGHLDCLRLLRERGADLRHDVGREGAHACALAGHLQILILLNEAGVDLGGCHEGSHPNCEAFFLARHERAQIESASAAAPTRSIGRI